jgi:hypothetical protein
MPPVTARRNPSPAPSKTVAMLALPKADPPRDRWGRPVLEGRTYTRVSTLAKTLDDTRALLNWNARITALGLAKSEDLIAAVATTDPDDKKTLDKIVEQAKERAASTAKATIGTATHTATELVDRGEDLDDLPDKVKVDAHAYRAAIDAHGLVPLAAEMFVVCDEVNAAGSFDRLMQGPSRVLIADLKGLHVNTPLPTPTGWTTMGSVQVGDRLFGSDGVPCTVTAKSDPKMIGTYIVTFDDKSTVVCDSEHIWWTRSGSVTNLEAAPTAKPIELIIATLHMYGQAHHRVPLPSPLDLPEANLPIDPYVLGCWLGDGTATTGVITKDDGLAQVLADDGHPIRTTRDTRKPHVVTIRVPGLTALIRKHGLLGHKHIPVAYLRGSHEQRLRLMQGLMDTDGTWNTARNRACFTSTDKGLALAMVELLHTLGQRPHLAAVQRSGFGKTVTAYDVEWTPFGIDPFRLPRKAAKVATSKRAGRDYRIITKIEPGPDVATACVAVDSPNSTYLCGDQMVPTHNTSGNPDTHKYAALAWAIQLAVYAHARPWIPGRGVVDWADLGLPTPDLERGLVIHVVQGTGQVRLHSIDLAAGWVAARLADEVLAMRKLRNVTTAIP